jgi:hypothetical protein
VISLKKVIELLEAKIITENPDLTKEYKNVYASDLMSNVLAFSKPGSLLLTSLSNIQVVRTAIITELSAVCFVNESNPEVGTIKLAKMNDIILLKTDYFLFDASGILYNSGLFENKK